MLVIFCCRHNITFDHARIIVEFIENEKAKYVFLCYSFGLIFMSVLLGKKINEYMFCFTGSYLKQPSGGIEVLRHLSLISDLLNQGPYLDIGLMETEKRDCRSLIMETGERNCRSWTTVV